MKNKSLLYTVFAIIIIALLTYFAIQPAHDHSHDEPEKVSTTVEAHSNNLQEVALNDLQFKSANIELGSFSQKNLSAVLSTNGYTKLPPQNQAEVSVYMSGSVKSINVIEGQAVKKGQVLAQIESPEYAKLHQEYKSSQSNLTFLKLENDRQKMLNDEGVSAGKVYQKAKSDYEVELSKSRSLQRQLQLLNINSNAAVATSAPVLAPISGFVTDVNITIGSTVDAGTPLFKIIDNSKLHVDLLVYEKDLAKINVGQTIRFVLTNQNNSQVDGTVFSIGKAFEDQTKTVAVHAEIANKESKLIPGMYVNALIDIGTNKVNALPVDAVVKADGREYIFVLEQHEGEGTTSEKTEYHFERVEVKSGTSQLGFVEVTPLHTLENDAKIVLRGAYYLQSHLLKSDGGGGHVH